MPSGTQLTSAYARADYTNQSSLQYGCTVLTVLTAVQKQRQLDSDVVSWWEFGTFTLLTPCSICYSVAPLLKQYSHPYWKAPVWSVVFFFGNHCMSSTFNQTYMALLHWKKPNFSWWKRYLDLLTSDWHQFQFCSQLKSTICKLYKERYAWLRW